jgi:hypothetical protein
MTDEQDVPRPGGEPMELVVPFVACISHGGPYDDHSFVAGFQAGAVSKMLEMAAVAGADRVSVHFAVYSDLGKQLELIGMHRGFPVVELAEVGETPDYAAMPQWSFATFATHNEEPDHA